MYTNVLKEHSFVIFRVEVNNGMARMLIGYLGVGRGLNQGDRKMASQSHGRERGNGAQSRPTDLGCRTSHSQGQKRG
jgi:hypothetical protein